MTSWRAALTGLAFGLAVLAGPLTSMGCAAPTLPLPPPSALSVSPPDVNGVVTITGHADPMAFVFVLDETTEMGVIVHATAAGTFTAQIPASSADQLHVWQAIGDRQSTPLFPTVP